MDFLVAKDNEPFLLVECKASASASLSPALAAFQKSLNAPWAFQIALDGDASDLDPREFENRPTKLSALDFFKVLV